VADVSGLVRCCAVGGVLALSIVCAGCVQTTGGMAMRAQGSDGPLPSNAPQLNESALDRLLLSVRDIGSIVDGSDVQVTTSAEEMSDHSSTVDDIDCLGTLYGAEEPVYAGSGWTAVRDEVIREPGSDNKHWIEQTVVLFPSADKARSFFNTSRDQWKGCANSSVTTTDSSYSTYVWKLDKVGNGGDAMITQDSEQQNANGWACQHAMGMVSNPIAEAFACGYSVSDEGERMVTKILQNAAAQ
jgi:hypothetical protein